MQGVLSSPFSHVWGAPGTGKTRYVLANRVLAICENKKIILVAFTNNALEQVLSGVLEVLFSEKISPSCIRRLSIPSNGFVSRYPDICEHQPTEARRSYLYGAVFTLQNPIILLKVCFHRPLLVVLFSIVVRQASVWCLYLLGPVLPPAYTAKYLLITEYLPFHYLVPYSYF